MLASPPDNEAGISNLKVKRTVCQIFDVYENVTGMEGQRYAKARDALHGVGLSVIGGALTTGGAAIPLMAAPNFLFFQQAGFFIFFTAFFGIIFSFGMLIPLLMVCGPVGETGDIFRTTKRVKEAVSGRLSGRSSGRLSRRVNPAEPDPVPVNSSLPVPSKQVA